MKTQGRWQPSSGGDLATADPGAPIQLKRRTYAYAIAGALFLLLLLLSLWNSGQRFNEDAVSYIAIARHYSAGQYALAINGYWGPLLSWALIPLLNVGIDPVLAGRLFGIPSAFVFVTAASMLFRRCGLRGAAHTFPLVLSACFALYWAFNIVSPDLMLAASLLLGVSFLSDRGMADLRAGVAGVCFAISYLLKPGGLPVSLLLISAVAIIGVVVQRRRLRDVLARVAVCTSALFVVSLPWILAVSWHAGRPTFTTSLSIHRAVAVEGEVLGGHPTFVRVHRPRQGRVTSWENPVELHSSSEGATTGLGAADQLKLVAKNALAIRQILLDFDLFGLGLAITAVSLALVFIRRGRHVGRLWLGSPVLVAASCAVYLVVFAGVERYYLLTYPLVLATAFGFAKDVLGNGDSNVCSKSTRAAYLLLLVAFSAHIVPRVAATVVLDRSTPDFVDARRLTADLRSKRTPPAPVVSFAPTPRATRIGYYTSFLWDVPYVGLATNRAGLCNAVSLGAKYVVVESITGPAHPRSLARRINQPPPDNRALPSFYSAAALCQGPLLQQRKSFR